MKLLIESDQKETVAWKIKVVTQRQLVKSKYHQEEEKVGIVLPINQHLVFKLTIED